MLLKHALHELSPLQFSELHFPPTAGGGGGGVLFHSMMAEEMRKCGNVTSDACDKAGDAKYSFPKRARGDGRRHAKMWKCHLICMR